MKLFLEEKYQDWLQKLTLIDLQRKGSCEDSNENKIPKVTEGKIKNSKYFIVWKTLILWFLKLKCRTF